MFHSFFTRVSWAFLKIFPRCFKVFCLSGGHHSFLSIRKACFDEFTHLDKITFKFVVLQGESKKRPPQFMLNISSYRHARKLGHNSLERWDP